MLPALPHTLTQAELMRLDHFLHSSACGHDAMGLSYAHGFLTAMASGPEQLETGEWLRLVFDEPVFEDGAQAQDVLGLALRLYQEIETSLDKPGGYQPILELQYNAAGQASVDAASWCQGYRAGMTLCAEEWASHSDGQLAALLAPIFTLARQPRAQLGPLYHQLCAQLPFAVQAIYHYWRADDTPC